MFHTDAVDPALDVNAEELPIYSRRDKREGTNKENNLNRGGKILGGEATMWTERILDVFSSDTENQRFLYENSLGTFSTNILHENSLRKFSRKNVNDEKSTKTRRKVYENSTKSLRKIDEKSTKSLRKVYDFILVIYTPIFRP